MPRISVIGQVLPELKKRKRVAAYARVSMETEMLLHSLSTQVSHYNGLIQKILIGSLRAYMRMRASAEGTQATATTSTGCLRTAMPGRLTWCW